MSTVLIVTHGTAGDVLQLIRLGRGLRERGHDVTLVTHSPYLDRARRAGLDFVTIDSADDYQRHLRATPDLLQLRSPADLRGFYQRGGMFAQLRFEVEAMVARHRPGDTVLLGRHGSALSVVLAAELLGAPAAWVALYPSQLMVAPVVEHFIATGLGPDLAEARAAFGLGPTSDWRAWLRSPGLTLALWPCWFDAAGTPAPPGTVVTGYLPGDEDDPADLPPSVAELLAGEIPPVLVTGGTGRMLVEEFYPVAVAAAAEVGRPIVVVTPHRDLLPDPLPTGLTWVPRLPFPDVFPRLGAILHHGGIGTAMRALRAGTPQVILPHGLDRPDNAERLARLRLAWWSGPKGWDAHAVADQLHDALADAGYRDRAVAAVADDDADAASLATSEALERLLHPVAGVGSIR